jgi:hypothetical protein
MDSSGMFSSTNFLSLTCSFSSPSFWATHLLVVFFFCPASCLNVQRGFKQGLNLHLMVVW